MISKIKIDYLVIWCTVLTTSLYVVANNLPILLGSFRYLWAPLSIVVILLYRPRAFFIKPMRTLLIYGIVVVLLLPYTLWNMMDEWNSSAILDEFYSLFIFVAIFNYYRIKRDYRNFALLGKSSFIFIIITVLMSHIALFFDPYVIRNSASALSLNAYQENIFKRTGAGGYGYMQALVCLLPILIYYIKSNQQVVLPRRLLIILLIAIFILIVRAQVMANILVAFLISSISFVSLDKAKKSIIGIFFFCIVLISIPTSFYADISTKLSSYFDNTSVIYERLNDFAMFIETPSIDTHPVTGTSEMVYRMERYPMLTRTFIEAPFFGAASLESSSYDLAGAHLYWMNRLTIWGICGFSIFAFMLYQVYKSIRSLFDDSFGFYYTLSALAFIILGLMKTIAGREPFLMLIVVIPALYFASQIQNNSKVNNTY